MKSDWKVTSNIINDKKMYAVYRLRDVNEVDHSGNREFAGGYIGSRTTAQTVVNLLNIEEAKNESKESKM